MCIGILPTCPQRTEDCVGYLGTGDVSWPVGAGNPTLAYWKSHFSNFLQISRVVFFFLTYRIHFLLNVHVPRHTFPTLEWFYSDNMFKGENVVLGKSRLNISKKMEWSISHGGPCMEA